MKNTTNKNYLEQLHKLFPTCITETKNKQGQLEQVVDWDAIEQFLYDTVANDTNERYQFTWVGKKAAFLEANEATDQTLRPVPEDSIDWDTTENLYIEGDNLQVLKLLQRDYTGKVKMIYIDPPYNTGNNFVYKDNFGRSHSNWCSMIYSRLLVARPLLSEDGVIFISIDDNEVHNLRKICDEVFGEENFVGELIHQRAKGGGRAKHIVKGHDYILVYARNISCVSLVRKKVIQQKTIEINGELFIKNDDVLRKTYGKYNKNDGNRRCFYEQIEQYKGVKKKKEIDKLIEEGALFLEPNKEGMHTICRYEKVSEATSKLYTIIKVLSEEGKKELEALGISFFSYPKPVELLKQLVEAGSDKNSLILDFFSGSATTAHAVMQLNAEDGGRRKYIMVQIPEETSEKSEAYKAGYNTICEIGKERIRRAGRKIKEIAENKNLDIGFRVLRLDSSNIENDKKL